MVIEIDGSMLEGGGQIVRTSLALSALTGKDVRIFDIRGKRPNPGLQPQHLVAAKILAAISDAETTGLVAGSRELLFSPRQHIPGKFTFNVGTAGSIPLILQALMPSAAYAPAQSEFQLTGGTDVKWSPTIDYLRLVFLPTLEKIGYKATVNVQLRGHYPKGGGLVSAIIDPPRKLSSIKMLEAADPVEFYGLSHCVKLPTHVAERQAAAATAKLSEAGFRDVKIAIETYSKDEDRHLGPGSGIILVCKLSNSVMLGADNIGERGKPAELIGGEAADKLLTEIKSKAPVDRHLGDMLIPYMAVAEGRSEIRVSKVTMHTLTNIKVTELLAGVKFHLEGGIDESGSISVEGLAMTS